jgi:DNA sulfur modification protein DndC
MTLHESTVELLRKQYLEDERPWVVAYSGGKDSTLVLQLVFELLLELGGEATKPVYVLSSDTQVEAPNVSTYVQNALKDIEKAARLRNLNLHTNLVEPELGEDFWSKLIGKGYPPPNRWFRWCTSSMKIKPSRRAVEKIAQQYGSVILLLGSRMDESSQRAKSIQSFSNNERGLNKHHEIPNALVFKPIVDWSTDEVWEYLYSNPPAWGGNHDELIRLYRQANGGECPIILDLNTPSCGGSRFGCWTCTVVKQDKSMEGFIATGEQHMTPLNRYREALMRYRDEPGMRSQVKRDGSMGNGPFNPEGRKRLLRELLETERESGLSLISDAQLASIQAIWHDEFDYTGEAARLIAAEFQREVAMGTGTQGKQDAGQILEQAAMEQGINPEILKSVLQTVRYRASKIDAWGAKPQLDRELEDLITKAAKQAEQATA